MINHPDLRVYRPSSMEMIDHQIELHERLNENDFQFTITSILSQGGAKQNAAHVPPLIRAHVAHGELYRLSVDMVSMIEQAAEQLVPTDKFDVTMLPTRCGLVRFNRPLVVTDVRGNYMLVHVMTWGPVKVKYPDGTFGDSTMFSMWNDVSVQLDTYTTRIMADFGDRYHKVFGRWSFISVESIADQTRVGPAMVSAQAVGIAVDENDTRTFTNSFRYFVALIDMMNQRIVRHDVEQVARPARRRAERSGLSSRSVTVIDLRRASTSSEDTTTSTVNWTRRWAVRGHYRRAKVGKGRQEVRRVWVSGHVKGPDDKPLIISTKIRDVK